MSNKREFWFNHIEAWRKSKMAQTEYARLHNLSIKSFGYFRRRYFHDQKTQTESKPPTLLPVSLVSDDDIKPASSFPGITLTCPGGYRVELASGFEPAALKQVLNILGAL